MRGKYIINRSDNLSSQHESFLVEFFGYNLTAFGIDKKIYLKAPFARKVYTDKIINLDDEKLKLVSTALNNKFFTSFISSKYFLYDICLRESDCAGGVGFNFVDLKDSTYIRPSLAVEPFLKFWNNTSFYETIKLVQNGMFQQKPNYNPISMIGVVVDGDEITSVKSYIRFNTEDAPSAIEREHMMERIIKSVKPNIQTTECISKFAKKLENLGFEFSFVGTDCYNNGSERFKLYFRFRGNNDLNYILKEVVELFSQMGLYSNIYEVLDENYSGIWGLAISTNTYENVNGIQLYFYP